MEETDVLVVGAGPTGLTLACALARAGARLCLVDRATARSPRSRALVVQLRSLEIFHQLGIAERLIAEGNRGTVARLHVQRRLGAEVPIRAEAFPGCRFDGPLFVAQDRTEAALEARLHALGHAARFGTALVGAEPREGRWVARCEGPDGPFEVTCRFLVGCDGAHSAVRHLAGIPFEGAAYAQDFVLADLDLAWEHPRSAFVGFLDREGFLVAIPMRERTRVISSRGRHVADLPEPTLDQVQALFTRLVPTPAELGDPAWITRFHLHHRIARSFRDGRILLAGDAAHIHSPVGGQGMNTGIQDAWNLGWKLAWALARPEAEEALLASYHEERRPVGLALLRTTDLAFRVASEQGWVARVLRSQVLPRAVALARLPALQRLALWRVSQLGIGYRGGRLGGPDRGSFREWRALRVGDRVPDLDLPSGPLHAQLHPRLPTVLRVGATGPGQALSRERGSFPELVLPEPDAGQRALLGAASGSCLLIRPDGHLAARAPRAGALADAILAGLAPPP